MGEFVFGLLCVAIIGMIACLIDEVQETKHIEKRVDKVGEKPVKPKKHYLLNEPLDPITLQQLRTLANLQEVEVEQLIKTLDENGYVVQWTKAKSVPSFNDLTVEQTVFEKYDPEGYVKLKIITKEYYKERGCRI